MVLLAFKNIHFNLKKKYYINDLPGRCLSVVRRGNRYLPSKVTIPVKMPGSETMVLQDLILISNFFLLYDQKILWSLCTYCVGTNVSILLVYLIDENRYASSTDKAKWPYISYLLLLDLPWLRCSGIGLLSKNIMVAVPGTVPMLWRWIILCPCAPGLSLVTE
jgi:hypothetical protein